LINPYNKTLLETSKATVFITNINELALYSKIMFVNLKIRLTKGMTFII